MCFSFFQISSILYLSGNPPPTIRWFLNGVDIAKNKNFRKRYRLLDQGHGLELQPTTQDDIGLWTCQAENAAGSSVANISLDVWGEQNFHPTHIQAYFISCANYKNDS